MALRLPLLVLAFAAVASPGPTAARGISPEDVDRLPTRVPHEVHRYGPAPQHYGQLRLPEGAGPFPVAVVVHGGCWTKGFATLANTAPLASALAERGIASWNIEYRQLGEPGAGWPGTFQDWGMATDALRDLAEEHPVDLSRVVTVGHSAGVRARAENSASYSSWAVWGDWPAAGSSADSSASPNASADRKRPRSSSVRAGLVTLRPAITIIFISNLPNVLKRLNLCAFLHDHYRPA